MHRQPYDEVAEVTLPPMQELRCLWCLVRPLFVVGTLFFLAGLFAPVEMARHGVSGFMRLRLLRLGGPWVLFTVLVWPLFTWLRLRDTFTVLVRHLFRRVRRNDLLCLRTPSGRDGCGGAGAGQSVSYQRGGLCGTWWAWSGWLSRLSWTFPDC